ncbi:MAG: hypothetical protein IT252_08075 [Chitinophagaceae bacterium]|nr:hypothetical protein [Chitinophagaceae bacterium]
MKGIFLIAAIILQSHCMAQLAVDSLQLVLRNRNLPESTQVNTLNELGTAFWKAGNDSLAYIQHRKAIAIAKKSGFYLGEAKARFQLVRMEMEHLEDVTTAHKHLDTTLMLAKQYNNDWIEAMTCFRKAQLYASGFYEHYDTVPILYERARALFVSSGDKAMEGSVYVELGTFVAAEGKYAQAIDYMLKGKKLQESTGDIKALRATIPNLGTMYLNLKMYDKALATFDEASKIAHQLNDKRVLAFIDYQKGFLYKEKKQYADALKYSLQAVKLFEEAGALQVLTNVYARVAQIYYLQNKLDSALKLNKYADSLYFAHVGIEETFFHYTNMNFARIYLAQQRYDSAIYFATMGRDTLEHTQVLLPEELSLYNEVLAKAYEAKGNFSKALFYYKDYKKWSDSLLNDETKQKVLAAGISYDFEKLQQASELDIRNLKAEKVRQTRNFLLVLLLALLLILGLLLWNYRQVRKKNKALIEKQAEIEKALFTGQKRERKRLAGELHDHLNTQLAAVRWYLEAMDLSNMEGHNLSLHNRVMQTSEELYRDMRMISHVLSPVALEDDDLQGALEKLVVRMNESQPTHLQLQYHVQDQLPEKVIRELYSIALELTANIARHAAATNGWISIQQTPDNILTLSVADDGKGMPAQQTSDGIGIQNVRQRAADIGAVLHIADRKPAGTIISIEMPMR